MEITNSTTVIELLQAGIFSIRTVNALNCMQIKDVGTLRSFLSSGKSLMEIRNFGKKSLKEVNDFLGSLPKEEGIASKDEVLYNALETIEKDTFENICSAKSVSSPVVAAYLKKHYETPYQLYAAIFSRHLEILNVRPELSMQENIAFRMYHIDIIKAYKSTLQSEQFLGKRRLFESIDLIIYDLTLNCEKFSGIEILEHYLTDKHKALLESKFEELCNARLSVRGLNFKNTFIKSYADLVKLFDAPLNAYKRLCPGQSKKVTIDEIYRFNAEFKDVFNDISSLTEEQIHENTMKERYAYLSSRQRQFVVEYTQRQHVRPIFYLLYNYLRISEDRQDKLYNLYYGFFDNQPKRIEDLTSISGVSRERIRQLLKEKMPATDVVVRSKSELLQYDYLFKLPYICEYTPEIATLKEKEKLHCSYLVFCSLVYQLSDYDFFRANRNYSILVKREILEKVDLKDVIRKLEEIVKGRYSEDTYIHVNAILENIPEDIKDVIGGIICHLAQRLHCVKVTKEGSMFFRQNWIDVEKEMYILLQQRGEPMHLNELFERFKEKYPEHKYTEPSSLRSFLLRSERIGAVGKTSTYALKEWNGIFFGSMRFLLYNILSESKEPVHIDTIMEKVLPFFPNTNQRSIESSMDDSLGRFVSFENGYFGLSERQYDKKYRFSYYRVTPFEERMVNYKNFIETYHRFPAASGGDEEASLRRWHYNVINGIIVLEPEQRAEFDEMVFFYKNKGYPTNLIENEFLNKCREYKAFIKQNRGRPTSTKGEDLYFWFRRSLENYKGYEDQRYNYFCDLVNYVKSFGFSI